MRSALLASSWRECPALLRRGREGQVAAGGFQVLDPFARGGQSPCAKTYRPQGSSFRRRARPERLRDQEGRRVLDHPIAPADGNETVPGKWEAGRRREDQGDLPKSPTASRSPWRSSPATAWCCG